MKPLIMVPQHFGVLGLIALHLGRPPNLLRDHILMRVCPFWFCAICGSNGFVAPFNSVNTPTKPSPSIKSQNSEQLSEVVPLQMCPSAGYKMLQILQGFYAPEACTTGVQHGT